MNLAFALSSRKTNSNVQYKDAMGVSVSSSAGTFTIRQTGKAFHTFKEGNDFIDVTLVSEDGQETKMHKIVLAASSSFFIRLLEKIFLSPPSHLSETIYL